MNAALLDNNMKKTVVKINKQKDKNTNTTKKSIDSAGIFLADQQQKRDLLSILDKRKNKMVSPSPNIF